jgi:rare lipoprotein A
VRRVLTRAALAVLLTSTLGAAPGKPASIHQAPVRTNNPAPATSGKPYQVGLATWYGKRAHGRKTCSGERFNMHSYTAAHRQLPLGSWVRVTNLSNRRWVIVRINDRGTLGHGRIIDLSLGAARALGMRSTGVERVRLDVVTPTQKPELMAQLRQQAADEQSFHDGR